MENRPVISDLELNKEPIKLEFQKKRILGLFDGDCKLTLKSLTKNIKTKYEFILTFLAILELIKNNLCVIKQNSVFGNIKLILLKN